MKYLPPCAIWSSICIASRALYNMIVTIPEVAIESIAGIAETGN